ncbi:amidohydrolase family protein [Myxococcota bacterium]|nr:amidohydrolase family protein [Myxococcota bacterium]
MLDLIVRNGTLVDGSGAAPRSADVAARDGRICEIAPAGSLEAESREVIDAEGLLVTPGFVDVHTHYDGQATWDPILGPSSWHGVTSVVMGNCGVGFAPAKPDRHQWLIELMEGVEDIPGSALADGMTWNWESFPEYLDELDGMGRAIEVAAQVPHGSVRAYVMGDRGARNEAATAADIDAMSRIVREGVEAGAVAFSSNRLPLHTSIHGVPVPGTFASEDELLAMIQSLAAIDRGVVEVVPAGAMGEDPDAPLREVELYRRLSLETGRTITFTLAQIQTQPDLWREVLERSEAANAEGAKLVPQVSGRPAGLLLSWETFNPFMDRPSYREIARLPLSERIVKLRDPSTRAKILSESQADGTGMAMMRNSYDTTFPLDGGPAFEPEPMDSVAGRAEREARPADEVVYDLMCDLAEDVSNPGFLHVFFSGYKHGNLDDIGSMMRHPATVVGLADGGAHCSMICDASMPTFVLVHWVRDRKRGDRIPIEQAVKLLSDDPAQLYGFSDRGRLEVGLRADLNVIDLDGLQLQTPEIIRDLPTGAPRVVQRAVGFRATAVAGQVTFRNGEHTGATPGRLIR